MARADGPSTLMRASVADLRPIAEAFGWEVANPQMLTKKLIVEYIVDKCQEH